MTRKLTWSRGPGTTDAARRKPTHMGSIVSADTPSSEPDSWGFPHDDRATTGYLQSLTARCPLARSVYPNIRFPRAEYRRESSCPNRKLRRDDGERRLARAHRPSRSPQDHRPSRALRVPRSDLGTKRAHHLLRPGLHRLRREQLQKRPARTVSAGRRKGHGARARPRRAPDEWKKAHRRSDRGSR